MESKIKQELSLDYIISQLEDLDLDINNIVEQKKIALDLGINVDFLVCVSQIHHSDMLIGKSGGATLEQLASNFNGISLKYSLILSNAKKNNKYCEVWQNLEKEIEIWISEIKIKLIRLIVQKHGLRKTLDARFTRSTSPGRIAAIDTAIVRYFKPELNEYLDQMKLSTLTERRFNILTKLLLNNPE